MASNSVQRFMLKNGKRTKRLEGLVKKIHELTVLCDIDAMLICYDGGEDKTSSSSTCYSWPENPNVCLSLIDKYKEKTIVGSSNFMGKRKRIVETQVAQSNIVKETEEYQMAVTKKPKRSQEFNVGSSKKVEKGGDCDFEGLGMDELQELLTQIDQVKSDVDHRIQFLKQKNQNKFLDLEDEIMIVQNFKESKNNFEMNCSAYSGLLDSVVSPDCALVNGFIGSNELMRVCDFVDNIDEGIELYDLRELLSPTEIGSSSQQRSVLGCSEYSSMADSIIFQNSALDIDEWIGLDQLKFGLDDGKVMVLPNYKEVENPIGIESSKEGSALGCDSCSCWSDFNVGQDFTPDTNFTNSFKSVQGGFTGGDDGIIGYDLGDIGEGFGFLALTNFSPSVDQLWTGHNRNRVREFKEEAANFWALNEHENQGSSLQWPVTG